MKSKDFEFGKKNHRKKSLIFGGQLKFISPCGASSRQERQYMFLRSGQGSRLGLAAQYALIKNEYGCAESIG